MSRSCTPSLCPFDLNGDIAPLFSDGVRLAELTTEHLCGLARCDTPVKMAVAGCEQNIGFLIPVPVRKLRKILTHQNSRYLVTPSGVRYGLQMRYKDCRGFVQ